MLEDIPFGQNDVPKEAPPSPRRETSNTLGRIVNDCQRSSKAGSSWNMPMSPMSLQHRAQSCASYSEIRMQLQFAFGRTLGKNNWLVSLKGLTVSNWGSSFTFKVEKKNIRMKPPTRQRESWVSAGKSPFFVGKYAISMAIFNSYVDYVSHYQRVPSCNAPWDPMVTFREYHQRFLRGKCGHWTTPSTLAGHGDIVARRLRDGHPVYEIKPLPRLSKLPWDHNL